MTTINSLNSANLSEAKYNTTALRVVRPQPFFIENWNPKFSPDGRYILFKYGFPKTFRFDWPSALFVYDTKTEDLKQITPQEVAYHYVSWSPDSDYITYVVGGDALGDTTATQGSEMLYTGPLQLKICNWRTGETVTVATNDTIRGPFHWIAPHTLTYGVLENNNTDVSKVLSKDSLPRIYEYSIEKRQSKLLFKNGFRPVPSPNGEWIAFFGSENSEKTLSLKDNWNDYPDNVSLSVTKRDGSNRRPLNLERSIYPFIIWLPDNQHLLTVKQTSFGKEGKAQIKEWDIKTGKFRLIAELVATDFKTIHRSNVTDPQFLPLSLSAEGKTLILAITEVVGRDPLLKSGALLLKRTSIKSVDITSGDITLIAQSVGDSGVDWHEARLQ